MSEWTIEKAREAIAPKMKNGIPEVQFLAPVGALLWALGRIEELETANVALGEMMTLRNLNLEISLKLAEDHIPHNAWGSYETERLKGEVDE